MTIETARRASLEFVCVFGQDGIEEGRLAASVRTGEHNQARGVGDALNGQVGEPLKVFDCGALESHANPPLVSGVFFRDCCLRSGARQRVIT